MVLKQTVCVTEKEFYKAREIFESSEVFNCIPAKLPEDILAETIRKNNAFAAVIGVDAFVNELYKALPMGGVIARFGIGHDGVDKIKATENGLLVTNTSGVLDDSVAEHAIWLIGALARHISQHNTNMKQKKWEPYCGMELKGKTLLLVGCGAIGCKVAKIASFGFDMNVIGYAAADRDAGKMKKEFSITAMADSLDDVLGQADFVSIHIPSTAETRCFVNKDFLSKMKQGAYLINSARGPIVDEIALYDVLIKNKSNRS
jgi:phosphoglycerate dehydrogenase-like enzyme